MIETRIEPQPLAARLRSELAGNPYFAPRHVRVEAEHGRVTLHGVVNSYFHKQMAQEAVRRVDGVAEVENLLEVNWT